MIMMMIYDDARDDDDDMRQRSTIRAVEQPFKLAAFWGDWDHCLVAFSNLINIILIILIIDLDKDDRDGDDRDEDEDNVEDGGDLSSDNARSSSNAVNLDATAGQYKCLLFPPCLITIIMRISH